MEQSQSQSLLETATRHRQELQVEIERLRGSQVQAERTLEARERAHRQRVKGLEEQVSLRARLWGLTPSPVQGAGCQSSDLGSELANTHLMFARNPPQRGSADPPGTVSESELTPPLTALRSPLSQICTLKDQLQQELRRYQPHYPASSLLPGN